MLFSSVGVGRLFIRLLLDEDRFYDFGEETAEGVYLGAGEGGGGKEGRDDAVGGEEDDGFAVLALAEGFGGWVVWWFGGSRAAVLRDASRGGVVVRWFGVHGLMAHITSSQLISGLPFFSANLLKKLLRLVFLEIGPNKPGVMCSSTSMA